MVFARSLRRAFLFFEAYINTKRIIKRYRRITACDGHDAGESLQVQNDIAEIKLRAERKAGELLRDMPKNAGAITPGTNRGTTQSHSATASKLADLGIEKHQSSRWQKIADVPDDIFEAHIVEQKQAGELTTAETAPAARSETPGKTGASIKIHREILTFPARTYIRSTAKERHIKGLTDTHIRIMMTGMDELNSKLTVLIPYALKRRFKELCTATDTEMSDEVRRFIEKWIKNAEKEKAKV